jgi:hypothetical protein
MKATDFYRGDVAGSIKYVCIVRDGFKEVEADVKVTEVTTFRSCLAYVIEHQEEATVYKVARILSRKNARRQLYERFLAKDQREAIDIFNKHYAAQAQGFTLQLCTGDWKVICETSFNNTDK